MEHENNVSKEVQKRIEEMKERAKDSPKAVSGAIELINDYNRTTDAQRQAVQGMPEPVPAVQGIPMKK